MKVVSADFFCSVVWQGARAACAEASTGSVEALKARLGFRSHMVPVYMEESKDLYSPPYLALS
jgi:hypothetical protein